MKKILILLLLGTTNSFAQKINGKVVDQLNSAIVGATVSWVDIPQSAVQTDGNGFFSIENIKGKERLV